MHQRSPFCPFRFRLAASIAVIAAAALGSSAGALQALPPAPEGVVIRQNVEYLEPGRKERLDLYLPDGRLKETRSPGVVIIHGGGWTGGSKSAGREFNIGTTLARAGYVCASIDYRLEPQGRWPMNVYDCKNAVRYLRKNAESLQLDSAHVGVIGGSAGGHLALMVGFTPGVAALDPPAPYPGISDGVQAVVDMYGVADIRTLQKTDPQGNPTGERRQATAVFGDRASVTHVDLAVASPVTHISRRVPPVLILHGTADTTVDRDQSTDLARRLKESGVEHQLLLLPGVGHTFDLQSWSRKPLPQDLRPVVVGFFDRHLKSSR